MQHGLQPWTKFLRHECRAAAFTFKDREPKVSRTERRVFHERL